MAADAGAGLEDVDAGVVVSEADKFPYVDAESVADEGEFVGEGDVDVAEGVFGEFCHFCGDIVGGEQLTFAERGVDAGGDFGGAGGLAADDSVVGNELFHGVAGQDSLGAVGEVEDGFAVEVAGAVGYEVGAESQDMLCHFLGSFGGRGGFEDDEFAAA